MAKKTVTTDTAGAAPHMHTATIDEDGNGRTTSKVGEGEDHVHQIVNGIVQEGGVDSHVHSITT